MLQVIATTPELAQIFKEEKEHFTKDKAAYTLVAFLSVFTVQLLHHTTDLFARPILATLVYSLYAATVVAQTAWAVQRVAYFNRIKKRDGYVYHCADLQFESLRDVLKMSLVCMVAAILCGLTGIAGGMVLGPLFLSYGMLP